MKNAELSSLNLEIGDARQTLFLYVAGNEVVGTCSLRHIGKVCADIARLYIVPARRGRGLGSGFLDQCTLTARASGCKSLGFEVDAQRDREKQLELVNWYIRRGFIVAYEHPDGSLIMAKSL